MNVVDKVIGISASVLALRSQRMEMISANLANADTPGYKAVDIDFKSALQKEMGGSQLLRTNDSHMDIQGSGSQETMYRVPSQPSLDGNTVESDREHMAFMENAIRYQASLDFLGNRIKSTLSALRGE
ncbi:flagellar basal body rod protein FlgB [Porticoccus sp.]